MKLTDLRRLAVAVLASLPLVALADEAVTTWIDSPEAYFITLRERNEWLAMRTDAEKEQFRDRYWTRRDPTPSTARNEFKEVVQGRIKVADQRFALEGIRGSSTARGKAFIVLGTPAHVLDRHNTPVQPAPNTAYSLSDGNETFSSWTYDKLRTPKILAAVNRAELELVFRIEPNRRIDMLENPGLFDTLRDQIAEMTVISRSSGASRAELAMEPIPGPELTKAIESQLDSASAKPTLATATIWREDDSPTTLIWLHAPEPSSTTPLMLYGRVRDANQKTVAAVSREVHPALGFTTLDQQLVVGSQLALPPGNYEATFMLIDSGSQKALATETARIVVPANGPALHVSSLLLTDTLAPAESTSAVSLGGTSLRPRADATFSKSESMWYVFQVMNPKDPASVKLHVMLRSRDGSSVKMTDVPAALQPAGPGSFIGGYELPLDGVAPGDYSLYVTVADAGREEVRRADFHVRDVTVR